MIGNVRTRFLNQDLSQDLLNVSTVIVRQRPSEHFHEDATQGPDINLVRDFPFRVVQFWCHVPGRPAVTTLLQRYMCFVHGLCETKVAKLRVVLLVEHNVQRFQIPMNYRRCQAVQVGNTLGDMQCNLRLLRGAESCLRLVQQMVQGSTAHEFRHDAQIGRYEACTDEAHEPWVLKVLQGAHLFLEFLQLERREIGSVLTEELLDGDFGSFKSAPVDGTEATSAETLSL
mmetsp:Transcript_32129/g.86050  ORF Transcript_32129/g.86050 Transcript_32129/m.86050 type:complete len:229 (-) Transcript_32129:2990-3676(-)